MATVASVDAENHNIVIVNHNESNVIHLLLIREQVTKLQKYDISAQPS